MNSYWISSDLKVIAIAYLDLRGVLVEWIAIGLDLRGVIVEWIAIGFI